MCGLLVVARREGVAPAIVHAAPEMLATMRHRGPDGGGMVRCASALLAHRRLAIVAPQDGHQPLPNEDETIWAVVNGEFYNHVALRRQLEQRGHRFRTRSDSEVVVHAFEEWGTAALQRLEGMFAFVLHDARTATTWAARDRLGEKPLFYTMLQGHLHLSSEVKGLLGSPFWQGDIDDEALDAYLALGYVPAPRTIHRGVHKLPPAHTLLWDQRGLCIQRYWTLSEFGTDRRASPVILDDLDARLAASVAARMPHGTAAGAFLSGGIDSGLVVSYMKESGAVAPLVFTAGVRNDGGSEYGSAGTTAQILGARHVLCDVPSDLAAAADRMARVFDEPFADPSAVMADALCSGARAHVRVTLTGDGADELFGGYDYRYAPHGHEEALRRVMGPLGHATAHLGARIWPRSRRLPRFLRLHNTFRNLSSTSSDAYFHDLCFTKPATVDALRGHRAQGVASGWAYERITGVYDECPSGEPLHRAQYADLHVYMPDGPLTKMDRMTMRYGLEARNPLLDHTLVEFAFRQGCRPGMRLRAESKPLLRRLARRRLSPVIARRRKQGFDPPLATWLQADRSAYGDAVLTSSSPLTGFIDLELLRRHCLEHRSGAVDHGHLLWSTWVLASWLRQRSHAATDLPGLTPGGRP